MKKYFDYYEYLNRIESEYYKKQYIKVFSDMGVLNDLAFRNVVVICEKETFEKQGRKNYPAKATETEYFALTLDKYLNCLTGVLFFHDRTHKRYDRFGYIPSYMTCSNPTKTTKIRRTFQYIDLEKIYDMGGYREKNILDNFDHVDFDYSNGYKVLTFFDDQNNSFEYSMKNKNICG